MDGQKVFKTLDFWFIDTWNNIDQLQWSGSCIIPYPLPLFRVLSSEVEFTSLSSSSEAQGNFQIELGKDLFCFTLWAVSIFYLTLELGRTTAYPSSMFSIPSGKSCHMRHPTPLLPLSLNFKNMSYIVLMNFYQNFGLNLSSFNDTPNSPKITGRLSTFWASSMCPSIQFWRNTRWSPDREFDNLS